MPDYNVLANLLLHMMLQCCWRRHHLWGIWLAPVCVESFQTVIGCSQICYYFYRLLQKTASSCFSAYSDTASIIWFLKSVFTHERRTDREGERQR